MLNKIFDPASIESRHYEAWENSGVFTAQPETDKPKFAVMMPPPNVTGSLHMGHALNMTLQDLLTRWHRMRGYDALWMPGTDHASIAVHMVLEKQLAEEGKSRADLGREEFMQKAWEWKAYSGGTITRQLRRLGTTPDWGRERFTMDEGLSRAVNKLFVQMAGEGLIYRANRLVNWDPERQTVISDLEVISKEVKSKLWHVRYPIEGEQERFITIATTRPETMLGDTAIAVHPDDERFKDVIGKYAVLPVVGRLIPIIADEYADPEQGSGAVKITPAHDFNDFEVGQRHNLEMISIFDKQARVNENAPDSYQGLDRFEARKQLLAELEELDFLVEIEDHVMMQPTGERSGVVIEPMLTDQWFCDAPTLAKNAIEAIEKEESRFIPKQWENTYFAWMRNIQPWCISRQLWWGHRIPAWYGPDGEVFVAADEAEAQEKAKAHYGEATELQQDEDVLDTWFSSGLWPFSTLGWPDNTAELKAYYPGTVLITGFDIIFFWVARMMMMGLYVMGDIPFKDIYIHALVRDSKGQKMSKSKGNIIDPLDLIDQYGADALRFTLCAMAAQGRDIRLSEQRVEGYRNFATKLWNAARYCEMNECLPQDGFEPDEVKETLNQWILSDWAATVKRVDQALSDYRFNEAAETLYHFIWGTFCDWYLEFTKPVLEQADKADETRAVTGWLLDQILTVLNPFMPFITEELYEKISQREEGDRLISGTWPDYGERFDHAEAMAEIDWLQRLIGEVRSVRADMNVPAKAKIALMVKDASAATLHRLEAYNATIMKMARLSEIRPLQGDMPKGSIQSVIDEATLILPIAELIDLDQERARLNKEIEKLEKELTQINGKLNNQGFLSNAPEEVVEEQKRRAEEAEQTRRKFTDALKQLSEAA